MYITTTVVLRQINTSPPRPRLRLRPRLRQRPHPGACRKLQIKVILICNTILFCSFYLFVPAKANAHISYDQTLELNYGTCPYRNFNSSSFAQPLPEAQRLEAMNAKVYNANE